MYNACYSDECITVVSNFGRTFFRPVIRLDSNMHGRGQGRPHLFAIPHMQPVDAAECVFLYLRASV